MKTIIICIVTTAFTFNYQLCEAKDGPIADEISMAHSFLLETEYGLTGALYHDKDFLKSHMDSLMFFDSVSVAHLGSFRTVVPGLTFHKYQICLANICGSYGVGIYKNRPWIATELQYDNSNNMISGIEQMVQSLNEIALSSPEAHVTLMEAPSLLTSYFRLLQGPYPLGPWLVGSIEGVLGRGICDERETLRANTRSAEVLEKLCERCSELGDICLGRRYPATMLSGNSVSVSVLLLDNMGRSFYLLFEFDSSGFHIIRNEFIGKFGPQLSVE